MKSKKFFIAWRMLAALTFALVLAGCGKKDSGGSASGGGSSGGSAGGDVAQAVSRAAGREAPASDFSYDLSADGQGIVIKGYTGKGGKVVIPAAIEDVPVVAIGGYSFQGQKNREYFPANDITEIVFPGSVVSIGEYAFVRNDGLKSITLPDGIKKISDSTFMSCTNLTTVNLPSSLEEIGSNAFASCGELNNLVIPDSLTSIKFEDTYVKGGNSFGSCGKLPIKTRQRLQALGYTGGF
ncbi:MAG: leucine-rich repeat domain-containing protein [Spirochaetales bacterium]|jgi:hypothetical protein|nr:leucine-rich repeat domain-containing protein [Spirochaetales bacterium]